jgi:hypothetical protein
MDSVAFADCARREGAIAANSAAAQNSGAIAADQELGFVNFMTPL